VSKPLPIPSLPPKHENGQDRRHRRERKKPMLPTIDYGALDDAETRTLAVRALEQLTVEDIVTVLKQVLDGDDRQEVAAQLNDE
jgi:hypothetical protein